MGRHIKRFIKLFFTVGIFLFITVFFVSFIVHLVKNRFVSKDDKSGPQLDIATTADLGDMSITSLGNGLIEYGGEVYSYNDDIKTFLIMGIDKADEEVSKVYGEINGGQSDALFLVVFNPDDKSVKIICINRNTMTDVDIYDKNDKYVRTVSAPIAIQHGFGDGTEESCERQKMAVSKLFYLLPIHGYAAINMSAINEINDAVRGVDVTPQYSFDAEGYQFTAQHKVHLVGNMAYAYLHERDVTQAGSADFRLQRHKEYLTAYIDRVKFLMKDNPRIVADIYSAIENQMTTDISLEEVFFFTTLSNDYKLSSNSFYMLSGVTSIGDVYEEFYPDKNELLKLMLEVFYEKP